MSLAAAVCFVLAYVNLVASAANLRMGHMGQFVFSAFAAGVCLICGAQILGAFDA